MGKGKQGKPSSWAVVLSDEVRAWLKQLTEEDAESATLVRAAINVLRDDGPGLGRPLVDTVKGSSIRNLKELRPGSSGRSEIRLLFVFDPQRQAVLLTAGDKQGNWNNWYTEAIKVAERVYAEYLAAQEKIQKKGEKK